MHRAVAIVGCVMSGCTGSCGAGEGTADSTPQIVDAATIDGALFPLARVRRWRVDAPIVDASHATTLAAQIGIVGTVVDEGYALRVEDGLHSLVVYTASGAFEYEDRNRVWNPSHVVTTVTAEEATSLSTAWLQERALLPDRATVTRTEPRYVKAEDGTIALNHWLVSYEITLDAAPAGDTPFPVPVSGAGIDVRVGDVTVVAVTWRSRPFVSDGEVALHADSVARDLAAETLVFTAFPRGAIDLVYDLAPPQEPQRWLEPTFLVRAAAPYDQVAVAVAASPVVPRARVIVPSGPIDSAAPVTIEAQISDGTPPYQVTWTSGLQHAFDDGGPVATGETASVALVPGAHRLVASIVDAEGVRAEASAHVVVTGEAPPPPPGAGPADELGPLAVNAHGWTMTATITASDGLELTNVKHHGHLLAVSMAMPFYTMITDLMPDGAICELASVPPAGGNCVSALQAPGIEVDSREKGVLVQACWRIGSLPQGAMCSGTMTMCQKWLFEADQRSCAPLDAVSCASYRPFVWYRYVPPADPTCPANDLRQIWVNQRFDFELTVGDRSAFYKDTDTVLDLVNGVTGLDLGATATEAFFDVAMTGNPGTMDNYHQRSGGAVVNYPGCSGRVNPGWTCAHTHWRWPSVVGEEWGDGHVLVNDEELIVARVLRYHIGEFDPPGYDVANLTNMEPVGNVDRDLILWCESRSRIDQLTFGGGHWFFR